MHLKKYAVLVAAFLSTLGFATGRAQTTTSAAPAAGEKAVVLDPFKVNAERDYGYRKLTSITTSRVGVSITEAPQAIEIISGEMLHDLDINSIRDAFNYSASVTKNSQEILQSGNYKLRGFQLPTFINGVVLAPSPSIPGNMSNDNVERIEVAKGPVGLFYGNSSPNGVANVITKRPGFINRTKVEIGGGSLDYQKAMIDTQAVVSQAHGIAYRLVMAADKSSTRLDQDTSYNMIAGSVVIRPSDKFRVELEYDVTNFQNTYASNNTWNYMLNPLYYEEVNNPSVTMLNYIKSKYGAATDAAALAVISSRWGKTGPGSFRTNWAADHFGAFGTVVYPNTGSTMNWAAISPQGDKFIAAGPDSNDDGTTSLADASVTFTPFEHTSIQYHWVHNINHQNFARQLFGYNSGPLDAQGHFPSLTIGADSRIRIGTSDAQQLDLSQELDTGAIKHRIVAGVELRRDKSRSGSATIDATRAPTRTKPDGTTTTGVATTQFYYPWTQELYPLSTTIASAIVIPGAKPNEYQDWYASYRASAFNKKLNVLAGVRSVKLMTSGNTATGESELTKTFGVIGEVHPGVYVFGSYNTDFVFSQGYTVNFLGNGLPVPGEGVPLGSETGKGMELGTKLTLMEDKLTGTISYFRIERDGVATSDIAKNNSDLRNLDLDPNNNVRWNLNGGLQRVSGFDGDLVYTPTNNLQLLGNLTYMHEAKTISDPSINITNIGVSENNARLYDKAFNHRLAKTPRYSANLVAKYNFREGAFKGSFVGGAIRYTDRYLLSDNFDYDIYVPAETKYDLFAGYATKFWDIPTTFQVNLQNITNEINDVTRDDGFLVKARVTLQF